MLVLGIETSCDETGLALLRDGKPVAERLASQVEVHALFGGVVPEIASRQHQRVIRPFFDKLLADADVTADDIDGIAVARGPGLLGALLVGMAFAKGLALSTGAHLIGVDHLHAHLLAPELGQETEYPALGLLVSGGHTHIYHIASPLEFTLQGRTLDDAAGEAFDKVAKLLNLPYPGGRHVDVLGQGYTPDTRMFPLPYINNDNLDFSFSGLKTAVLNHVQKHPEMKLSYAAGNDQGELDIPEKVREDLGTMLASFNHAVAETLVIKMQRALERTPDVKSVVVAGGVAANSMIRTYMTRFAEKNGLALNLPGLSLCTDNAIMIARAGWHLLSAGYCHDLTLDSIPRGQAVPQDYKPIRNGQA